MTCLTKLDLENAQRDISDLAAVINGPQSGTPSTVTTRLGTSIKTLARALYETTIPTGSAIAALLDTYLGYTGWRNNSREKLTATRIYYVKTTGSDSNDGLTFANAFQTIQKAIDTYIKNLDTDIYDVYISVSDGTYTSGGTVNGKPPGRGTLFIQGNLTTPSNVIINTTSSDAFSCRNGAYVNIRGFKITTTTSGRGILSEIHSSVTYGNINFGSCAQSQVECGVDSYLYAAFNYEISGSAVSHFHSAASGALILTNPITITLTGTPNFSAYFAGSAFGGMLLQNLTFVGSATGKRYLAHKMSCIDVGVTSETYLPGSIAGTVESGGKYVGDVTYPDLIGLSNQSYTPTLTAQANVSAFTAYETRWHRIGNVVFVSGRLSVTATSSASVSTQLRISLPVASNLTDVNTDASGVAITPWGAVAAIMPEITTDTALLQFVCTTAITTGPHVFSFDFSYTVK